MTTAAHPIAPAPTPAAPQPRRWFVLALAVAVLTYSMMQTMLVPVLPALASALHTDRVGVSWVLTAYLLAGAVAAPVLGAFGDRFGHRRMLLITMGVFVVGSVVSALAPGLGLLLIGRVLQGASTASFPLALAIVGTHATGDRRRSATGWLSGTVGLGAGLALVVGGVLADIASWQWLFWTGAGCGILSLVLVAIAVPARPALGQGAVDLPGIGLLAVVLVGVLLAVSQASSWGIGSPAVLVALGAAIVAGVALVVVERRAKAPLLDLPVLARPTIAISNLLGVLLGLVPYLFYVGLPILLQTAAPSGPGLSTQATGWVMFPGTVLAFFGGRFAPVLMRRRKASWVAVLSMVLLTVSALGTAFAVDSVPWLIVWYCVMGLGCGIGFTVVADVIAAGSRPDEVGGLLGVNGVLRTVGSSFGAPVATLVLAGVAGDAGFTVLFLVAAVAALAGGVAALFLRPARV
ncbi:MFS transporter [Microbacterium sp. NEAU-LLC]|uniref:MFS transporter n=1 Tax=Microbacterium helvum TaxID=2773713 RepID=A0ABR8NMF3_9MICO|nr:MFS transporter [Microbacterium helvum]MBD3941845.1 MFS transporter [Microbacterium helvum]